MPRTSVFLPTGFQLSVVSTGLTTGRAIYRAPGIKQITQIGAGQTRLIGPFNEPRNYIINSRRGRFTLSVALATVVDQGEVSGEPSTDVTAVEDGTKNIHATVLTVNTTLPSIDGDTNQGISSELYTFPEGSIIIDRAYMNLAVTQSDGNITADTPTMSLGMDGLQGTVTEAADAVIGVPFSTDTNATFNDDGTTTGAASTSGSLPSIVGGKAVMSSNNNVIFPFNNKAQLSIRFKYTPNYTSGEGPDKLMISVDNDTDAQSRIRVWHNTTNDDINIVITDTNDAAYSFGASGLGNGEMVSGVEAEMLVTFDSATGIVQLFKDGTKLGQSSSPSAVLWDTVATNLIVGDWASGSGDVDASYRDVILYDVVLFTATYMPGYSIGSQSPEDLAAASDVLAGQVLTDADGTATIKTVVNQIKAFEVADSHKLYCSVYDTWATSGDTGPNLTGTVVIHWRFNE